MSISLFQAKNECSEYRNSILTCNVQSINKNFNAVKDLILRLEHLKIIILVEIWQPKISFSIDNYHDPINFIRNKKRGGGLSIIIHESLRYQNFDEINNLKCTEIEKLAVITYEKNGKRTLVIGCYRPPNVDLRKSLKELESIMEIAHLTNLPTIITGDFNINLAETNHIGSKYIELLQKYQLLQIIDKPTRVTTRKKSILDHTIINSKIGPTKADTICFSIADHLPILTLWDQKKEKNTKENTLIRKVNYKKLTDTIKDFEIDSIESMNCNEAFDKLHENVTKKVEECKYNMPKKQRKKNEWISQECIKLGREVNRLKKKFLRINTIFNEFLYKRTKREYQKMIRREKDKYYKTKLENCRGDSHRTWVIINELLNRKTNKAVNKNDIIIDNGKEYKTEKEISTFMNNYYKNIAFEIEQNIKKSGKNYEYYLKQSNQSEEPFQLETVSEQEVLTTIKKMANKNSEGPDGISNRILKIISPHIIKYLTICINKSFNEERFPESLKVTKVSPIDKKLDRTIAANWRPIAQLSPFSKAFEKVFLNQLNEQSENNSIINENQFGFRSKHSTVHPMLLIKNFIEEEIQKKNHVIMVTIDVQKAFDCVKTDGILQNKIKYYSKSEKLTNWIDSYYKNRKQFTQWGKTASEIVNNHPISIVQGSNLGSKMFNYYINDLPNTFKLSKSRIFMFADDCAYVASDPNPEILNQLINQEMTQMKDYFDSNFLSISIKKSNYLHFKPKNKQFQKFNIKLGTEELEEKEFVTYLGVIFDNKMQFNEHFKKVYDKMKSGLNGLIITKNQLNYRAKLAVYHSLIHSHLAYCGMIWMKNLNQKQCNRLSVIQKKAIRIIHGARYNAHTNELFQKSKITKSENIFESQSLVLTYQYQQRKLPEAILKLYDNSLYNRNLMTRYLNNCNLKPKIEIKKVN